MKRVVVCVFTLALLVATPGLAAAQPARTASNQQAVDFVIARALAQRGVPFTYGGGDSSGPTRGVARTPAPAPAGAVGLGAVPATPGLGATPVVPGLAPTPEPATNVIGFDASGLVVYAFAGVGIKLPRSSGEQYKVGRKILPNQALPGDLIFYGPEGTQSVAMFVGNGLMLEATDPGVTVSAVRYNNMAPYLSRIID